MNGDGLTGCDKLQNSDHIIIFFTKNAMKINMSEIANHGAAELRMIEIPAGKQSADIHISSYLGYLAGMNREKECSVVIVSKDTDFDNVIEFWKTKAGILVSRSQQIQAQQEKPAEEKKTKRSRRKPAKSAVLPDENEQKNKNKSALNNEIMQILSKAGFENKIVASVASTVVKNMDEQKGKQQIYRAIISKYGQNVGLNIYNQIRKHI